MVTLQPFELLEQELAEWMGYPPEHMVVCASGTAALHLAFECISVHARKVLMGDYNMIACPRAVSMAELIPEFLDCRNDLNLGPEHLQGWLEGTSIIGEGGGFGMRERDHYAGAVLATHIYGRRCDMEAIHKILEEHLYTPVVEDMAELHGIKPHPETTAACWSFFKNKVVHCRDGEGGAVAFKHREQAARARQLRSLGFTTAHDYYHTPRGHNYRLSNLHALPILTSLAAVKDNLEWRQMIEGWYDELCPQEWKMPKRDSVWVYDVRLPGLGYEKMTRVVQALNRGGIQARQGFKPMSAQEEYKQAHHPPTPNAYKASNEVFYLPVQPGIVTRSSVKQAFDIIYRELA